MTNLSDEKLVEQYLSGDSQPLELLIQRYLNMIYGFVLGYLKDRDEAEEVTQLVFVKVWKNLSGFRNNYKFKPWLFAIAKNTSLDYLKKKRPITMSELEQADSSDFIETLADASPSPLEKLALKENYQALELALESLPAGERVTLDLRYDQDLKFREIAELLSQSIDTVKTRNRRGLERLKKLLS